MKKNSHKVYRILLQKTLKNIRIEAGLRQEDVAERLGQPQSFVSKYESGERRLDLAELSDICNTLGITLEVLISKLGDGLK
jgi:transcriptional regulator with XRE-family HTH domain